MEKITLHFIGSLFVHIILKGEKDYNIFEENNDKKKYIDIMKTIFENHKVKIISYCIMQNYMHMIVFSEDSKYISDFLRDANSRYAKYFNKKYIKEKREFRGRFKAKPIFRKDRLYKTIKYIHMNPIKYEIVKKENQYPYSSYNDYKQQNSFITKEILKLIFIGEDGDEYRYEEIIKPIKKNTDKTLIKTKIEPYKEFLKLEYKELYQEKEENNIKKIIDEYLKHRKIHIQTLREEPNEIKKFISYLVLNSYEYDNTELCKQLKVSSSTLCRRFGCKILY